MGDVSFPRLGRAQSGFAHHADGHLSLFALAAVGGEAIAMIEKTEIRWKGLPRFQLQGAVRINLFHFHNIPGAQSRGWTFSAQEKLFAWRDADALFAKDAEFIRVGRC